MIKYNFSLLTEKGKRPNNEDAIFPEKLNVDTFTFIVCDGVGGAEKGEIASSLTCKVLSEHLIGLKSEEQIREFIQAGVVKAQQVLQDFAKDHPLSEGMATTLAMIHFFENKVAIVHIGDSRVYHIRNKEILYVTRDHSYVNDLVATGYITQEEAKTHPDKNIITRAISTDGNDTKADIKMISDIQSGDYFFLCSDGILEAIDEIYLSQQLTNDHKLSTSKNLENLIVLIRGQCAEKTKDNYSAILIQTN